MPSRPWVISVLSTDYDLHEYRDAIISRLREKPVVVSAFELPDFPVKSNVHSHDACLLALDRVDIALLIVDKRYGGIYVGDPASSKSITAAEYLTVVGKGKPCFVFVSRRSWDELHSYKKQYKAWIDSHLYTPEQIKCGDAKKDFTGQYTCTYVQSMETLDFIADLQKAYAKYGASNWIDQFDGINDIVSQIEGKLKGHSRFVLEGLVKRQKQIIESRHTSTGFSLSLSDVFSRGYYLEPSYNTESGVLQAGSTLDNGLLKTLQNNVSILVYGEAGYGKTTILAKTYLSHVDTCLAEDSYEIPFYLWLKKKNESYHFDFSQYIDESFLDDWTREPYPYMDLSSIRPCFYFDGFDEIAEKMTAETVERISRASMFAFPVLLTCRQQYAFRYISNFDFSDKFSIRVKINTWSPSMAIEYINNFCRINGKSQEFAATVHHLLSDNPELQGILNNPLLVTMMLWIIEQNRMRIPETIRTRIQLFRACVFQLAKRELARLNQSESFADDLVVVWSFASWEVYFSKLKNTPLKLSVLIQSLKNTLQTVRIDYSPAHFEALFDCSGEEIFGTFHEQFLEYLSANAIFLACKSAEYPFPDFLSYVIRPEINRYFRAIWHESEACDKASVVTNIHEQYLKNLGDNSFTAISTRVHAIYHICRFDLPQRQELINKAFNNESHISVRLSLLFGAIKLGRLDDEEEFYKLLTTEASYNDANRGYHLAYYADAIMDNQLPFTDNTEKKWIGTLRAFIRHFNSTEREHYFLRRIDLVTMEQLISARNQVEPMSIDVLNELSRCIFSSQYSKTYPEFQAKIEVAFASLKRVFDEIVNGC